MAFSTLNAHIRTIDGDNYFETSLKTKVTDGTDTNIYLNALPTASEGFLTIEPTVASAKEIIFYTSKGADYVTVPSASVGRGIGGTTAQGHAVSSIVRQSNPAEWMEVMRDRIICLNDGWVPIEETVTCSADNVLTISATGYGLGIELGDKMKVTDDGVIAYGIVVAKTTTSATIIARNAAGGVVTVANGSTITLPYFSKQKSPIGFPMSPAHWTITTSSTTKRQTNTPNAGQWYNAESIAIPIGVWNVKYEACVQVYKAATGSYQALTTLSTANNSESDKAYTALSQALNTYGSVTSVSRSGVLTLDAAATYYLNYSTDAASMTEIDVRGDLATTVITATCAYL